VVGRDRRLGPNQTIQVSQTILSQVLEQNLAVLSNDIPGDETFREAESLLEPKVRAVLAVPLEVQDKSWACSTSIPVRKDPASIPGFATGDRARERGCAGD